MTTETRAAIYVRVSTEAQDGEDRTSLDEQRRECEALAQRQGLDVVQVYRDVASGAQRDRVSWVRMLADAQAGRLTHVLAWRSDRLARTGSSMGDLLDAIGKHGVDVQTVTGDFTVQHAELMASIGRMEREAIKQRTLSGKRGTARAGRLPFGTVVYGYRRGDDGLAVVNEDEALVVRALFDLYTNEQRGIPAVAQDLRERFGFSRTFASMYQMLRNSAYVGRMMYDGISIPCPAIIDGDTWERTQDRLTGRRRSLRQTASLPYLLQGMMRCQTCGAMLGARTRREKGGTAPTLRYYKCRAFTKTCRPHPYIKANDIEARVWGEVVDVLKRPDLLVDRYRASQDVDTLADDLRDAQKDLAKWTTKGDRLISLYTSDAITRDEFDRQRKYITEPTEAAQARLERLRQQQADLSSGDNVVAAFVEASQRFLAGLEGLDGEGRKRILRDVVAGITLDSEDTPHYQLRIPAAPTIYASSAEAKADGWPLSTDSTATGCP